MPGIDPSEVLSRFILHKDWYRSSDATVKYAAFLPNRNGETSVFRTSGLSEQKVWDIAECEVFPVRRLPILGRADIPAAIPTGKGLEVVPKEPSRRHANITGWPEEKPKQKQIALELATESVFHKK